MKRVENRFSMKKGKINDEKISSINKKFLLRVKFAYFCLEKYLKSQKNPWGKFWQDKQFIYVYNGNVIQCY